MRIVIEKAARELSLWDGEQLLHRCRAALGREPVGAKGQEGDGRTPEGVYTICLVKEQGKYGRSLGLSYPGVQDATRGLAQGRIDQATHDVIVDRLAQGMRPPWGTALGGEIYLHEGGSETDWTQGCIALNQEDMDAVFPLWQQITEVEIRA